MGGGFSLASGSVALSNGLNITKLMLAILTVVYDLIFVVQHYVLYKGNDENTQKLIEDLVEVEAEDPVEGINRTEEGTDNSAKGEIEKEKE